MRLAERNLRRYPDGYLVVRFEDLVQRPEACVREVCGFLGETFVPPMLGMTDAPEHRRKLAGGEPSDGVSLSRGFIGRYREIVPARELMFMQLHLGRTMRSYGYTPDPVHPSIRERATFLTLEWPNQFARMSAWRTLEGLQQRFPAVVKRTPGPRMIVEPKEDR